MTTSSNAETISIFVSYSHKDKRWVQEGPFGIVPWLATQLRRDHAEFWIDHNLQELPGEDYKRKIHAEIARARFALLLINQDFVGSDFIRDYELPWIRERYDAGQLLIIPLLVGPTDMDDRDDLRWLADLQMLPHGAVPLLRYLKDEPAWEEAKVDIYRALRKRVKECMPLASPPPAPVITPAPIQEPLPPVLPSGADVHVEHTDAPVVVQQQALVALLYKRNAQPDDHVLHLLETQLRANGYRVFIDRHLTVGVEWAREIERQVRGADAVIPLLSALSAQSEMLTYEVQVAHEHAQQNQGKPRLLPVRVQYADPLPPPLSGILDPLEYTLWESPRDDAHLVADLLRGLSAPSPAPRRLDLSSPGGAMPLDSPLYVVRTADEEFRSALARRDMIVLLKGARQMGKTSLLARGLKAVRDNKVQTALTDFQTFNAEQLASADALFRTIAEWFYDLFELETPPEKEWSALRGANANFERYLRRHVLKHLSGPLVWGLDEVDRLFTCDFAGEVFGLFRSWHNARALDPTAPWSQLTLAIAYATEAHLFITDINQSPFNVGTRLTLEDFTREQVADLNRRYGSPLRNEAELGRFCRLVGGQPYLVQRGLNEMVTHQGDIGTLEAQADRDEGPFGDHLRRMLVVLAKDADLLEVVRGILRGTPCPTAEHFYRLRSAGIMIGESSRDAHPRCGVYTSYLERHLLS